MKRVAWALGFVICALGVFWLQRAPELESPVPTSQPHIKRERLGSPLVPEAPGNSKRPPAVSKRPPDETPPEMVAFKVDGELAIAHGDIILGTVDADEKISEGYYNPLRPQLWQSTDIPYHINPDLPEPQRIEAALKQIESQTSLRFVPFNGQEDAIVFVRGDKHCYSYLGRIGGHQPIQLSDKCSPPAILHETMHALGFIHEHTRTDRNDYVRVNWDNVDDEYVLQFEMVPEPLMDPIKGTPFDYESIMLYPPNAFAKDPAAPTLVPVGGKALNPQNAQLSRGDVERIYRLYGN